MKYILQYTKHAKKDLGAINKKDLKRIILKLEYFLNNNPLTFSKALSGALKGLFRFRIGDYRLIFHKNAKNKITILTILKIRHRKEIYE
ncbi:MAG: type II toxin-antitoxin system mRNA interferase toxin, RelE/StbE family [Patescibacteria group bacterium]|nr:type II toxin-antitoxin system mRNA interferase toxin, RelE/StbE family [Patescibacteria group bacterium]